MLNIQDIFSKPVKRAELASALGVRSDREARRILSELQKQYNIINLQDGKGYFLADNETALRYAEQERRRALKSFNKANEMVRRCKSNVTPQEHEVRLEGGTFGKTHGEASTICRCEAEANVLTAIDGILVPVRAHMRRIGEKAGSVNESQVIFELEG